MTTHPYIIEVPQSAIEYALREAGIEGVVLYEVPETAVLAGTEGVCLTADSETGKARPASLEEAAGNKFNWQSVWAAAEVANGDFHRFLQAVCEEAIRFGRFEHFIAAVRLAVIEETEPGRTAVVFRGVQWDPEYPFDNKTEDALPEPVEG